MTARFKGFTLVELLIVIAIIGVLAVVVLVAINPVEQLAKTRDAGRISTVTQVGHAIQAYYTAHATQTNQYPTEAGPWYTELTTSGELSTFPSLIGYSGVITPCSAADNEYNGYCYDLDVSGSGYGAIVYARMESNNQNSKCTTVPEVAYAVFSSGDGRGGIVCADPALELDPWAASSQIYQ